MWGIAILVECDNYCLFKAWAYSVDATLLIARVRGKHWRLACLAGITIACLQNECAPAPFYDTHLSTRTPNVQACTQVRANTNTQERTCARPQERTRAMEPVSGVGVFPLRPVNLAVANRGLVIELFDRLGNQCMKIPAWVPQGIGLSSERKRRRQLDHVRALPLRATLAAAQRRCRSETPLQHVNNSTS